MKKYFLITISASILNSCLGDPVSSSQSSDLLTISRYFNEAGQIKGGGTILVQSNNFLINQNLSNTTSISQKGSVEKIKVYDNGRNPISLNDNYIKLNKLYGTKLFYSFDNVQNELYVPKLLNVSFTDNQYLKVGNIVKWNADLDNKKGIILLFTYKPTVQLMHIADKNRQYIKRALKNIINFD